MNIIIERITLSDNSYVYNVRVGNAPESYEAISEEDALSLAVKIREAIYSHTNTVAYISHSY